MTRGLTSERGAALLVAMVAVAVLTALAVDFAYDTRVSLQIAANARDELRATYAAKGGVALSRLVLSLQQQIDGQFQPSQGMSIPRPQIWRLVPVDASLAANLFGGESERPAAEFETAIDDEASKVNMQLEGTDQGLLPAQVQGVYQLVCDPRWDFLFDREDANGLRVSRQDLLVYLRDWVNDQGTSSALAASFPPGRCMMTIPSKAFDPGFGDKNYAYDRGPDRYKAKNARMDSLDELYLVAGVGDAFMAAFGDSITVYLGRDDKRNVNDLDRDRLLENAKLIANPQGQPLLYDEAFAETLQKAVMERTLGGLLTISSSDFGKLVADCGVIVDQTKVDSKNWFTDRSTVFRIRARGKAGAVAKQLDVVVRFAGQAGLQAAGTLGKPIHWREE